MFYGLFMYGYQGQYVVNPSYLSISKYSVQTAGNVFSIVASIIAGSLYGNIGVKVVYNNIFVELFHAPPLTVMAGKLVWVAIVPIYWAIAFVIAASIPNFSGLEGVVASICILQFTYTFPPMLSIGYWVRRNALKAGEGFNPETGETMRLDGGIRRIIRGFFGRRWWMQTFNLFFFLGALALAGLGAYASIEVLILAFNSGSATSFTCHSPLDG